MTGVEAIVSAGAFLALFALLLAACVTDIRSRIIPNRVVAAVAALWVAWRIALGVLAGAFDVAAIAGGIAGALAFAAGLLAFTALAERRTGKLMMGGGDVKLLAAVALFLGLQGALVALFAACVVSFAYAAMRSSRGIPFAPCILCGTLLALLAI